MPLRERQSDVVARSRPAAPRSSWRRNVICGCVAATTTGAVSSVPSRRTTPRTRPPAVRMRSTGASHRISAPKLRALDAAPPRPRPSRRRRRPRAEVPVADLPDRVVRHHVAGPRLVRAGPGPDQAVQRHHGLHLVGLEEPVEDVHDRHRHQARDICDPAHLQPPEPPHELQLLLKVADRHRPDPRRGGHQQRPEHRREPADPRVPLLDRVGVTLGELRELVVVRLGVVVGLHDASPVRERHEVRARPARR